MTDTPSADTDAGGQVGVGLLGLGVVGSAVAAALEDGASRPGSAGAELKLRRALVRDPNRARPIKLERGLLSTDPAEVVDDPGADIVVELMGGEEPARTLIERSLRNGKHVVTANKEVISKHGDSLAELSAENGVSLYFEASVGGGIPILGPLTNDLVANRIRSLRAIINGTTNYILTRMAADGAQFEDALKEAQTLGYAEADPTSDVESFDASYKISILAWLAFGTRVPNEAIYREGIQGVDARDFKYAKQLGYTIKLLAAAQRNDEGLLVRAHPALVPLDVPMANVNDVLNVVEVEGDLVGPLWLQGRGAGAEPTASAVLGDIWRVVRDMRTGQMAPRRHDAGQPAPSILPMSAHVSQYYLRITALDRAGVLARIAGILGQHAISIHSVLQMDNDETRGTADLVIMTHRAREANIQHAAAQLRDLDVVDKLDNLIRVESYSRSA